jgi:integrase/recombinase XerD
VDVLTTIAAFKRHLKAAGYADATLDIYRKGLSQFLRYLQEKNIGDVRSIGHGVIVDYQLLVRQQPVAMETKALKLRPVKRLFEHLVAAHKLLINPAEGIVETCRKRRKIPPVLTLGEVQRLMDQPDLSLKTGIRDRAIMQVLYATAIRLGELLALEVHHADLADKVLFVRKGKGGGQRVVPLGKTASAWLQRYLQESRSCLVRKTPGQRRLFVLNTGAALTPACLRGQLRCHRLQADIDKPVSPHTFRRTCATHMLQAGADVRAIQKLLGHRHLRTTQSYLKIMPVEVKRMHEATHPGKDLYEDKSADRHLPDPS